MIYAIDIDETICFSPEDRDYTKSVPFTDRIDLINKLYDEGHTIFYWTSRGITTGKQWYEFTYKQLQGWGCKFHFLLTNKPMYDVIIDDKSIRPEELEKWAR